MTQHHHCGHSHHDHDLDEQLHQRFHHLQHHHRHGALNATLDPTQADEMVLDRLADRIPGCPQACAGADHRAQAQAAFDLSLLLERDRWDFYCQARG
ncbi:hypothetical protein [Kitasatospora sp. NPDC059462]|uniref:hypothetical protein n=1 Tax=Kitasatospora sp. NPDC059462 TaxID=3346841 RepID=UPI0036C94772